jgi:hypothetical protein
VRIIPRVFSYRANPSPDDTTHFGGQYIGRCFFLIGTVQTIVVCSAASISGSGANSQIIGARSQVFHVTVCFRPVGLIAGQGEHDLEPIAADEASASFRVE